MAAAAVEEEKSGAEAAAKEEAAAAAAMRRDWGRRGVRSMAVDGGVVYHGELLLSSTKAPPCPPLLQGGLGPSRVA